MKYLAMLILVAGCDVYYIPGISKVIGPKFKAGDCIDSEEAKPSEFSEEVDLDHGNGASHPRKILKVGKNNYLYLYRSIIVADEIEDIDMFNNKVDCASVGY
jgi:hypothetical protein